MTFSYNWQASLAALALTIAVVAIGQFLIFKIPALKLTREQNRVANKPKFRHPRYQPVIKASQKLGTWTNIVFFVALLPFFVDFASPPLLTILWQVFLILMVYDFFYYLTHRFLFHGQGYFRRVHAVHHQARRPTSIDAHLVHPLETFIGIGLYFATIMGLSVIQGAPFPVATIVITMVIYTQLNQFNHVHVQLHRFPYKTLNWIADKHAVHHIDMHRGNYATITLLFDRLFGTFDSDAKTEARVELSSETP